ncbi:MAG: SGNH/GDSL hydrolase family protein [bacterium]
MGKGVRALAPNLILLAISGLVVFAGLEIALRILAPSEMIYPPEQGRGKASRFDPLLGWANKEGATVDLTTREFSATVTINSKGLRGREIPYERTPGKARIALLGDSFAWGFGVSDDDALAPQLERTLGDGVEVVNMGVIGYGTDQEVLFYENEGRRYSPDLVLLVFCLNDVENNVSDRDRWYGKPRFVLDSDSLTLTNVPVSSDAKWDDWLTEFRPERAANDRVPFKRRFRAYTFLTERYYKLRERLEIVRPGLFSDGFNPQREEAWRVTFRLLERLRRDVEADGARFAVLLVPRLEQLRYPSWVRVNVTLSAFCEGAGIEFYDFLHAYRRAPNGESMFFPVDGHWNAAGHRFAAEKLAEHLRSAGLYPVPRAAAPSASTVATADSVASGGMR